MDIYRYFSLELDARLNQDRLPFIQVLLGPRQIGKSTALAQILSRWPYASVSDTADGVAAPSSEWITFLWQKAREHRAPCLLIIDEIQKVEGWSETVKILFDRDRHKPGLKVVLSGSASLGLQQGLTESLTGRYELIRCPHWGLDECAEAFRWDLLTYLKFGGYPAAASLISEPVRWQAFIKDGIVEPVLGRDLQSLVSVQKPALLRQLFALAMQYPAQEISYQKLLGQLQDRGNAATIKHYLEILAGAFLLTTLDKYSVGTVRQKASSPKILPLAPALIHGFSSPTLMDSDPTWRGRVFECAIGAHLHRLNADLYYWRDGDLELDYVVQVGKQLIAVEVKSGRRRKAGGLLEFKKRYPQAECVMLDWERGQNWLSGKASLERLKQFV